PAPVPGRAERPRMAQGQSGNPYAGRYGNQGRSGNVRDFPRGRQNFREPMATPSARLSASPIVRGHRTALPPREALILMAAVNHRWVLAEDAEAFAELEFLNPDADHLRRAMLDAVTDGGDADSEGLRAAIAARGLTGVLDRVAAAITHGSDWPARA